MTKEKTATQKIIDAALIENDLKKRQFRLSGGDWYEREITANFFVQNPVYYYLVDITDKPVSLKDWTDLNPNVKVTKGLYSIQYIPAGSVRRNPKFPYLIGQDLVRLRVTVSGPIHWGHLCDRIPELGWLKRNSTLTPEMFRIAKMHPGLVIKFTVDVVNYCKKIEDRAKELGIDIDHKPLAVYAWNKNATEEFRSRKLADKRTKADYIQQLADAERASTVLDEIRSGMKDEK